MLDGVWHEALAAGLVDRARSAFDDDGLQPGLSRVDGGRKSAGAAAGDDEVDHVKLASAVFSVVMRVASKAPLSTVKTSAVIQAVWTRGSAMPSAITAT